MRGRGKEGGVKDKEKEIYLQLVLNAAPVKQDEVLNIL